MALSKCWILVFKQTANIYLCTPMSLWQNKTLQNCTPVKRNIIIDHQALQKT